MKMKRDQSSGALTPLPPSAASITRWSGEIGSPPTSGTRGRIQTVAGPGSRNPPRAKTISIAVCQPTRSPVGKNSSASAPAHHLAVRALQRSLEQLDAAPRAYHPCANGQRQDRDRSEDFDGYAPE